MKVVHQHDVPYRDKPEGERASYFMFDDYEVIQTDQPPHTVQQWHHHELIAETLYILTGELVLKWRLGGTEKSVLLKPGDLVETGRESHTIANESDKVARMLCIKRVSTGKNYREVFKTDKIVD